MRQSKKPPDNTFLLNMTWLKETWSNKNIQASITGSFVVQTFSECNYHYTGDIFPQGPNVVLCF